MAQARQEPARVASISAVTPWRGMFFPRIYNACDPMAVKPTTAESHWARHAAQWADFGSPLRPVAEDSGLYWRAITASLTESALAGARVLLLGVTPELASLPWPGNASLLAVDSSLPMLHGIWPAVKFPGAFAARLNADWLAVPLRSCACHLVIGDGSLSVFAGTSAYRRCAQELHRVLRPDGHAVLRLFCQPESPESPAQVLADLRDGHVGNFHAFKWRLVMAIHASDMRACLADVWACWAAEFPAPEEVAALTGWPLGQIRTLESYRDAPARYNFFSLPEVQALLSPEFELLDAVRPAYELGERCPIVRFRRRYP